MPGVEDLFAQLYQQRAMQTMAESDEQTSGILAQLRAQRANPVHTLSPVDRMPVLMKNDDDGFARTVGANDLSADIERGKAVPTQRLHGLHPADILRGYAFGTQMGEYNKVLNQDPSIDYVAPANRPAAQQGLVYSPVDAMGVRVERARLLDDAAQANGGKLPAALLQDKPVPEAMQDLVDQLNARRERLGAGTLGAWASTFSESI